MGQKAAQMSFAREGIIKSCRMFSVDQQPGLTAPLHFSTAAKSSYLLNIRVNLGSIESQPTLRHQRIRTEIVDAVICCES